MSESNPGYYAAMKAQPIDVIRATQSSEQYAGYLHGNCVKYLLRYPVHDVPGKGGVVDLKKARQYLDWLIELEESL